MDQNKNNNIDVSDEIVEKQEDFPINDDEDSNDYVDFNALNANVDDDDQEENNKTDDSANENIEIQNEVGTTMNNQEKSNLGIFYIGKNKFST